VVNALIYNSAELITRVKYFIVQAHGCSFVVS
jgi:hypothetical protein